MMVTSITRIIRLEYITQNFVLIIQLLTSSLSNKIQKICQMSPDLLFSEKRGFWRQTGLFGVKAIMDLAEGFRPSHLHVRFC